MPQESRLAGSTCAMDACLEDECIGVQNCALDPNTLRGSSCAVKTVSARPSDQPAKFSPVCFRLGIWLAGWERWLLAGTSSYGHNPTSSSFSAFPTPPSLSQIPAQGLEKITFRANLLSVRCPFDMGKRNAPATGPSHG